MTTKQELLFCAVSVVVGCIVMGIFIHNYHAETKKIERYGVETVGVITDRLKVRKRGGPSYSVNYTFMHNGEIIRRNQDVGFDPFREAIVGGRYKVMYLPDNPKKARIYINEPVYE